jgi:hypothetical protein
LPEAGIRGGGGGAAPRSLLFTLRTTMLNSCPVLTVSGR